MLKLVNMAVLAALGLSAPAVAQGLMSPVQPPQTTWQPVSASLGQLLRDGYGIQSVAGEEGQILILHRNGRFVRCQLSKSVSETRPLDVVNAVYSRCHELN
jgi:hypothetical protein